MATMPTVWHRGFPEFARYGDLPNEWRSLRGAIPDLDRRIASSVLPTQLYH